MTESNEVIFQRLFSKDNYLTDKEQSEDLPEDFLLLNENLVTAFEAKVRNSRQHKSWTKYRHIVFPSWFFYIIEI